MPSPQLVGFLQKHEHEHASNQLGITDDTAQEISTRGQCPRLVYFHSLLLPCLTNCLETGQEGVAVNGLAVSHLNNQHSGLHSCHQLSLFLLPTGAVGL